MNAAGSTVEPVSWPVAERRAELDFLRVFVVAGLVVFHSAVVFASGTPWFVKDAQPYVGFTVFLLWGSLWGMPLLFVVSGMGVRHAMRTRAAGGFVRERLGRLLVPFVVGLVLLVPPMFYLERLGQPGFDEPYWRFWRSFLDVPAIAAGLLPRGSWTSSGVVFDPAHLWFLYVLLLFSVTLLPMFWYLRRPRGILLVDRMAGLADRHAGIVLLSAAVPLAVVEAGFGPDVNTGGWERLAYVFPLLYGYLIAADRRFEAALRRGRRLALAGALMGTAVLVGWAGILRRSGVDVMSGASRGWSALQGLTGWLWIAAILGFAAALTARRSARSPAPGAAPSANPAPRSQRLARYANEAVLPCYLLHEPVIVAAAWLIVRWNAPTLGKYPLLVIVSFAGTVGLYQALIRPFRLSRLLFGMKPRPAGQPAGTVE